MNEREYQRERRRRRRVEQLLPDAACILCGENDPLCLQWHHVAGVAFGDDKVILCQNHHSRVSDKQKDHPPTLAAAPTRSECAGRLLLGIADLMELLRDPPELIDLVRHIGLDLIERGQLFNHPDDEGEP